MVENVKRSGGNAGARKSVHAAPSSARRPTASMAARGPAVDPILLRRWRDPNWWDYVLAWWEGYDTSALQREARRNGAFNRPRGPSSPVSFPTPETAGASSTSLPGTVARPDPMDAIRPLEVTDLGRDSEPVWTVERVKGAELLWGPDSTGPSDPAWMVDAVRQFGLGPARSVLDLSAGLGGAARAIAGTYDTWVTGLESSPVLAALAMQRSKAAGMGKKAPVSAYDPDHFNQAGVFDLVYGDRLVHRVKDKGFFLDGLTDCVKDKGGLLLFDYVVDGAPSSWELWNKWRETEPVDVSPWSVRRFSDELVQRNFDVRVGEDLTELHRRQIINRVQRLADALRSVSTEGGLLGGIARELALWWSRLRVLGNGLHLYRFVAHKLA